MKSERQARSQNTDSLGGYKAPWEATGGHQALGVISLGLYFLEDHYSFSVKNGLEMPIVAVEGNFIYISEKYLRTYFHHSKHLMCSIIINNILQMVIAAMKLKDAYSLEGKLWPT